MTKQSYVLIFAIIALSILVGVSYYYFSPNSLRQFTTHETLERVGPHELCQEDYQCPEGYICGQKIDNLPGARGTCIPRQEVLQEPEQETEVPISTSESGGETCGSYIRDGVKEEHCAICGNNICEPFEQCTSSHCSAEGACTDDCGALYCPGDCDGTRNKSQ